VIHFLRFLFDGFVFVCVWLAAAAAQRIWRVMAGENAQEEGR
jgi:hypothetical protein